MCVAVSMEPGTQLSLDEVTRMTNANADGAGFAWAEDGVVHWYKTVNYTPEYLTKLINERMGYFRLVHFRLATVGGVKAELCHPFEVGPLANPSATGRGARVLIHNGHWSRWDDIYDLWKKEGALPDYGPWSDSRFMAMLANEQQEWLDVVGGRVALMSGDGSTEFWGDWAKLRDGILVSNRIWESHTYNYKRHGRSSGLNHTWQGAPWGLTKEEYDEYERWSGDFHGKKGSYEQKGTTQGAQGKEEEKATTGVVSKSTNGAVPSNGRASGDSGGGVRGGGKEGGELLHQGNGREGTGERSEKERIDFTPWQNPASGKWYAVNPKTIGTRGGTGTMEITAEDAMRLMGQATPSTTAPRDGDRHQGEGSDPGDA